MNDFRARIGRVRMKSGGADVHIIEGFALPDEESPEATLNRSAREAADGGGVAAFALTVFMSDGRVLFNWRHTDECPIARTLLPEYIGELVRRYALTRHEAEETFDSMFQWAE